jgi:hypothetical protein
MAAYIPATLEQEAEAEREFQEIRATAQWYVCVCYTREIRDVLAAALVDYPKLQQKIGSLNWRDLPEVAIRAIRDERQRVIAVGRQIDAERIVKESAEMKRALPDGEDNTRASQRLSQCEVCEKVTSDVPAIIPRHTTTTL